MAMSRKRLMTDPTHRDLFVKICECLSNFGAFNVQVVLRMIGIRGEPISVIYWHALAKYAAKDLNMRLTPVTESGFAGRGKRKTLQISEGDNNPSRHLVTGGRRVPAGWVSVANIGAAPVIREKVIMQRKISAGFGRSADDIEGRLNTAFAAQSRLPGLECPA